MTVSMGIYSLRPFISVSPVTSASVPLCAVVPLRQAELLLQQGVHSGQPYAGVLHHAVRETEFIPTSTAASNGRIGLEERPQP